MKIRRKDFLKGIAIGTISMPVVLRSCMGENLAQQRRSASKVSGERYDWKMVTTWPSNFPIIGDACNLFATWANEMSGGRMNIRVYGGGELVPALEAFDAVRNGSAEMGNGAAYYWAGKAPAAQFFASVPFGMNTQQLSTWIVSGGGLELWQELYSGLNVVPMYGGNTGAQMGGWFNKEINTPEDLKGLKMRIPGLGGKVLEKAGGSPILLAGGEIYTGLERGVIDATEWLGPFHDYKMGFHQIAKYYYTPGWQECGTALEFFINKEKYDSLPPDLQAILQGAGARVAQWYTAEMEFKNSEMLQVMRKEGIDIRRFPKPVLDSLRQHTEEALAEICAADPFSKRVYDSYNAFRKQISGWADISEKVFYDEIQ